MEQNFFEETEMAQTTLQDFEELCAKLFEEQQAIEAAEKVVDQLKEAHKGTKKRVSAILEAHQKDKHQGRLGTVYFHEVTSWKLPEGPENKKLFFTHLKERGIFEDIASVHSKTLNSYCKREMEAAIERGDVTYKVPGIGEPITIKDLRLRKGK